MAKEIDELINEFVAEGGDFRDWRPSYNIAPTETIPVLLQSVKGDGDVTRHLEPARWPLVPSRSKTLKLTYPTFNARSEDLASKTTWRGPLKTHRALVPASGYFEWQTFSDGTKIPHYIHNPDGELLMLAGLYSWWKDHTLADDDPNAWTLTATILTSGAVDELLQIHDRNPVMLPPSGGTAGSMRNLRALKNSSTLQCRRRCRSPVPSRYTKLHCCHFEETGPISSSG